MGVRGPATILQVLAMVVLGLAGSDYFQDREQFLKDEAGMFLGAQLDLSPKEVTVNELLMEYKVQEYEGALSSHNLTFNPARHFFHAKADIIRSDVYKFIQKMPKGAVLHGHDFALASTEFLVQNLTYRDHLFICESGGQVLLHFFAEPDTTCAWKLLSDVRRDSGDVQAFDAWLTGKLTLFVPNPEEAYKDINAVWSKFNDIFAAVGGLLSYRPVLQDYFYQVLTELHQDRVMYLEFRAVLGPLYELTGPELTGVDVAAALEAASRRFAVAHPRFLGSRLIYAPVRRVDASTVYDYLDVFRALRKELPDFVAGFDLVGQEDMGAPLRDLLEPILQFQAEGARFFFHAGETNWEGETDENLVDAILLNTSRIGHGYALVKHPLALRAVKDRDIAIEVNPLSNQVLLLVSDLRNHPAAALLADNYPVVIAPDDPSLWGAHGLSFDFYEAFMGLAGRNADLRVLKQLAINSIKYSAMPAEQKAQAMQVWTEDWEDFLDGVLLSVNLVRPRFDPPAGLKHEDDHSVLDNEVRVLLQ